VIPRMMLVPIVATSFAMLDGVVLLAGGDIDNERSGGFREILEMSDLGPAVLSELSLEPEFLDNDWRRLAQLFHRLRQYSSAELDRWTSEGSLRDWNTTPESAVGHLYKLRGVVESVEPFTAPPELVEILGFATIFRCRFRFDESDTTVTVFASKIPRRWSRRSNMAQSLDEPVRIRAILLQINRQADKPTALLLADHIAWYPTDGVPSGQLFLARLGMDIALLDEIVQRQPFVREEISREGDAFYAMLKALAATKEEELALLAKENVAAVAERWRTRQPDLRRTHKTLKKQLAASSGERQKQLQKKVDAARDQRGLAAAVLEQSEKRRSSVAPMFLQPEEEVGELVRIEGTARRVIRIAAERPEWKDYFEMEVFTADSRNLPIVCCVTRLPKGFPTGDVVREPVRVSGIFFKNWRYRSRAEAKSRGETAGRSSLYTPVIIGVAPKWLARAGGGKNRWGLWGGVVFLTALAAWWIWMMRVGADDRRRRSARRKDDEIAI